MTASDTRVQHPRPLRLLPLPRLPRMAVLILCIALLLGLLAGAGLWHLRQNIFQTQSRELGLLGLALSDEVDRSLQGAEEVLRAVRAELEAGQIPAAGATAASALKRLTDVLPLFGRLWMVDAQGRLLAASEPGPAPALQLFTTALAQTERDAIAVSRPFADARGGASLVALALRFDDLRGHSGWLLAGVPATRLLGPFSAATPSPDARMAVYRSDGALLVGSIVSVGSVNESEVAKRLNRADDVAVHTFSDGSVRLLSLHALPRYDLKLVLTRDLSVVLLGWNEATQVVGVLALLLLAIVSGALYLVRRANAKRTVAQQALQAQLKRASKLESLGTMAGGVAHDFNNILAAIVGYAEMAQDAAPAHSAQERQLGRVLQAALRGKTLVERILVFGRGGARASVTFEIEAVVQEVLAMLAVSLKAGILIERRMHATGACVHGDPTQVFEAVMNLCANAMQAMPAGGTLVVSVERVEVTELRVLSHSQLLPGPYIALAVSDQGGGISADTMEHLFEPFFTTRAAQAGTGLGLAVVHGVMAELRGAIDVQSPRGVGSCFTLYMPQASGAVQLEAPKPEAALPRSRHEILVVDDEPALVELVLQELSALGYAPTGFSNPLLALQAVQHNPQRFSAIVTDEVMPEMTGTQLALRILALAPRLPVLLVSGYGGALLAQRAHAAGISRVLTKPVPRAELSRAMASLLAD